MHIYTTFAKVQTMCITGENKNRQNLNVRITIIIPETFGTKYENDFGKVREVVINCHS